MLSATRGTAPYSVRCCWRDPAFQGYADHEVVEVGGRLTYPPAQAALFAP